MENESKKTSKKEVTITPEQLEEEIRERAKQIFMERGDTPGDALSDWLQAEKEIKKKYNLD